MKKQVAPWPAASSCSALVFPSNAADREAPSLYSPQPTGAAANISVSKLATIARIRSAFVEPGDSTGRMTSTAGCTDASDVPARSVLAYTSQLGGEAADRGRWSAVRVHFRWEYMCRPAAAPSCSATLTTRLRYALPEVVKRKSPITARVCIPRGVLDVAIHLKVVRPPRKTAGGVGSAKDAVKQAKGRPSGGSRIQGLRPGCLTLSPVAAELRATLRPEGR
jgi:hypothetical protein